MVEVSADADYLTSLEDIAMYLEVALEDPTAVPRALGVIARTGNMSELARRVGMSRDGLYKALSADEIRHGPRFSE